MLLIDEIDALVGDTLVSVLRQLRSGYDQRPAAFPQSVVLCGLRDVRDYRIHASSEKEVITGGSAFNIRSESLRLGDFSRREVLSLLAQHTEETGQTFTPEAAERVWTQTRGQPWLVNALAYEACFDNKRGRDRSRPITCDDIDDAQEALILRRETHLDQLTDKLQEDRVRRVIEPILAGSDEPAFSARDLEYVRDLGLIAQDDPVRLANPIYGEVVPRELTYAVQAGLVQETAWYVTPDGGLDVVKLLAAFQTFFREHSEHWSRRFTFQEAWPQLLLQAFLQRIVNGGGRVEREHGLGRRRADLVILWPQRGRQAQVRRRAQSPAAQPGEDASRRPRTDRRLHGPLRRRIRPPRHRRPRRRHVGGQDVPPRRVARRRRDSRMGHVTPRPRWPGAFLTCLGARASSPRTCPLPRLPMASLLYDTAANFHFPRQDRL